MTVRVQRIPLTTPLPPMTDSWFQRPMGVTEPADAELFRQLRAEVIDRDTRIDQLEAEKRIANRPMRVVNEYTTKDTRVAEVVAVALTLERMGYEVGVKWHRNSRGVPDGMVIAVVEEAE